MLKILPGRPWPATRRWLRRGCYAGLLATCLAVTTTAAGALWVRDQADGRVHSVETVPPAPVALVLGSEVYPGGEPSPFLAARLELARRLYVAGKVKAVLVSGDHSRWSYDEPGAMQVWLVARGVPARQVVLDYAGFDTYDSCARAKRIFGVEQAIVVTQTYHLERAVALCRQLGIDATGVGDDSVRVYREPWRRASVREHGAVVKAVADVVSRRDPVFLGRRETGVEIALSDG